MSRLRGWDASIFTSKDQRAYPRAVFDQGVCVMDGMNISTGPELPSTTIDLLWKACEDFEAHFGTKNGTTCLYWHLANIMADHAEISIRAEQNESTLGELVPAEPLAQPQTPVLTEGDDKND